MRNILFIEDNADLSYVTIYALEKEEMKVDLAETLQQARKMFTQSQYDLILLDVMLPDGLGYDFCKEIREESNIPIIFLTACDTEANVVMGLDIGGDDYITKPFRIRELTSRINSILRRQGSSEKHMLLSGNVKVILSECRVLVEEQEKILTATEYKLLLAFLNNPKQILKREQLLDALWDVEGKFIDNNTLSVYIKRLRAKINLNDKEKECIETVRGLGYRWNKEVITF